MSELLYESILTIHFYRFPLTACLLVLSIILILIPFNQNVRKNFILFSICLLVLMVFMILRVELRSPFSRPSVNDKQVEILIQSLEKDSEKVISTIKESGTRAEFCMNESYYLDHNDWQTIIVTIYSKDEYWDANDLLTADFDCYEYSDKFDFRKELKSNGYFEQDNSKGIRVICYPVIYRVDSKWSSIYLPFEPDGSYQERIVIMFDESVIEFIGESELKCTLDLGKELQVIIDKLNQ